MTMTMTAYPTSLAGLKRFLKPGMKLWRKHSKNYGGGPAVFPVARVTTVAFTMTVPEGQDPIRPTKSYESWHHFEKAGAYVFTPEGFTVTLDRPGMTEPIVVEYKYVAEEM